MNIFGAKQAVDSREGCLKLQELPYSPSELEDWNFCPPSANASYNYDASGIRWRRIMNVNETIEIKSSLFLVCYLESLTIYRVAQKLTQRFIDRAIGQWRRRLECVVQHEGGHVEHTLFPVVNFLKCVVSCYRNRLVFN